MSAELIAILAVGAALGVPLWAAMRDLRREVGRVARGVGELRERMAGLKGSLKATPASRHPRRPSFRQPGGSTETALYSAAR